MSGYQAAHIRTRKARGKASEHVCDCGAPAAEWAYIPCANELVSPDGLRYSEDPYDYKAMCRSCHQRFDKGVKTHCPQGHPYEGEHLRITKRGTRACRTCHNARQRARLRERWREDPEFRARRYASQVAYEARKRAAS